MIKSISLENLELILPLIKQYQEFYGVCDKSNEINAEYFSQFGYEDEKGCQFAYFQDDVPLAFATVYFSFSSTITSKVGIMNDLFVLKAHRGKGIAKLLITHCLEYSLAQGAARLQWVTASNNFVAQNTYKKLPASSSNWLIYTLKS